MKYAGNFDSKQLIFAGLTSAFAISAIVFIVHVDSTPLAAASVAIAIISAGITTTLCCRGHSSDNQPGMIHDTSFSVAEGAVAHHLPSPSPVPLNTVYFA